MSSKFVGQFNGAPTNIKPGSSSGGNAGSAGSIEVLKHDINQNLFDIKTTTNLVGLKYDKILQINTGKIEILTGEMLPVDVETEVVSYAET